MKKVTTLHIATLLVAVLSAFGSAETHPRALELFQLNAYLFESEAQREMPAAISMNMTIRDLAHGTGTILNSTAIDWSREVARIRSCVDGELMMDAVYEGGTMTVWDAYSGEIATEPLPEGQMQQLMDQALTDPMSLIADIDTTRIRYDGVVDYGVLSGEQIAVPYEHMAPFPGVPASGETRIIFSPEGVLLGMMMDTELGQILAVLDGIVITELGPTMRGMTMYQAAEDGEMEPLLQMRMWNARAYDSLGDEWFTLDPSDYASTTSTMAEMRRRLDALSERMTEMEPLDPGFEEAFAEFEALADQLRNYEPASVPCPDPF